MEVSEVSELKPKSWIFKCKKCYCLCKDKEQFENHMKLHEENKKYVNKNTDDDDHPGKTRENDISNNDVDIVKIFKCDVCEKEFKTSLILKHHLCNINTEVNIKEEEIFENFSDTGNTEGQKI